MCMTYEYSKKEHFQNTAHFESSIQFILGLGFFVGLLGFGPLDPYPVILGLCFDILF